MKFFYIALILISCYITTKLSNKHFSGKSEPYITDEDYIQAINISVADHKKSEIAKRRTDAAHVISIIVIAFTVSLIGNFSTSEFQSLSHPVFELEYFINDLWTLLTRTLVMTLFYFWGFALIETIVHASLETRLVNDKGNINFVALALVLLSIFLIAFIFKVL